MVWSVTSGKRQILMDGKEIHYSATRTGVIDHSWSSKGNHVLKVVCHAAPPMSANPGFRQYDMTIDGQSFFNMPKVYELGVASGGASRGHVSAGASAGGSGPGGIASPRTRDEEELELQRAINASLEESRKHLRENGPSTQAPAPSQAVDLFGFDQPAAAPAPPMPSSDARSVMSYNSAPTQVAPYASPPPPQQAYPGAPPPQQPYPGAPSYPSAPAPGGMLALPPTPTQPNYASSPPAQPIQAQNSFGSSPPPVQTQPSFGASPQPSYLGTPESSLIPPASSPTTGGSYANAFAPAMHATDDPFAPKPPTQQDIASEILKGYSATTPTGAGPAPGGFETPGHPAAPHPTPVAGVPQPQGAPTPLSMNGGLITSADDEENLSELEKAMRKLVNVEHIDEPAEEKLKLTMKEQKEVESAKKKGKSKPLPPAAQRMVGSGATLAQISTVKPKKEPPQNVMKAAPWDPNAAAAGMLVVHGQPNQGPPPLAPRGFGVVHGQQFAAPMQPQMMQPQMAPQQAYPPQQGYPPQQQGYQQGYPPQQQYR